MTGPAAPTIERLFFATCPPPEAADAILARAADSADAHGLTSRRIARERLHVTLAWLGAHAPLAETLVDEARAAAAEVAVPRFDLVFDHVGALGNREGATPWVLLGGHGAHTLHDALQRALARRGIAPQAMQFTPHVTLGRDAARVPLHKVPAIAWNVHDFVLFASRDGARDYRELGRWQLGRTA